jgi:hypothetical protein
MILTATAVLMLAGVAPPTGEATVQEFLTAWLSGERLAFSHLKNARALAKFYTKHLQRVLDDADACQANWGEQQPPDSTDKPPFVDCCIFASSPEGMPNSFRIDHTVPLANGRTKVFVEFTFVDTPVGDRRSAREPESWRWLDAVIVARVGGRYLIDDFIYVSRYQGEPDLYLSESFEGCRGAKWVGDKAG